MHLFHKYKLVEEKQHDCGVIKVFKCTHEGCMKTRSVEDLHHQVDDWQISDTFEEAWMQTITPRHNYIGTCRKCSCTVER